MTSNPVATRSSVLKITRLAAPLLLLSVGAMAQAPSTPGSIFVNGARTYYEATDLGTPEATAQAFLSAWTRRDYATVNVILSPVARQSWYRAVVQTFEFRDLFASNADAVKDALMGDQAKWKEVEDDPNMMFDALLQAAERANALPFTLGPAMKAGQPTLSGTRAALPVATGGNPTEITLVLVRLPSGRWRVDQIVLPDGDRSLKPWGLKAK